MSDENTTTEGTVEVDFAEMSKGEKVFFATGAVTVLGIFVAAVIASIKADREQWEEYRQRKAELEQKRQEKVEWMNDESAKGNLVYELWDKSYLVVPRNSDQKVVLK